MRILIIQTAFIGDCVLTTPLIRRTAEVFGEEAVIVVLTTPQGAQVFDRNPRIDEIISYDKRDGDAGLSTYFGLANSLVERHFDIAISPHRSFRSGFLSMMARIPERVGFSKSAGAIFYTKKVARPADKPEAERMLELLKPFSADVQPCATELFPGELRESAARAILQGFGIEKGEPFITVAPGSVWATKRYPAELYIETMQLLFSNKIVEKAVLIGGRGDIELCEGIAEAVGEGAFSAAGTGDILTSAAIIAESSLLVGNDSSPGHLAAAMKTPVVSIFGPTVPRFGFVPYGEDVTLIEPPIDLPCRPCGPHGRMKCPRGDLACMVSIFPERVAQTIEESLIRDC